MMTLFMTRLVHGDLFEDRTEHERAFSPWWTALEGYTKFSIILVGKTSLEYRKSASRVRSICLLPGFFALPQANNYLECTQVSLNGTNAVSPYSNAVTKCQRENIYELSVGEHCVHKWILHNRVSGALRILFSLYHCLRAGCLSCGGKIFRQVREYH